MRRRTGPLLLLVLLLTALGGATTIDPSVIDYAPDDNPYGFTLELTNPGDEPASTIDLALGTADPDNPDNLEAAGITAVPSGWNATILQSTDGDNHTVRLTTDDPLSADGSIDIGLELTVRSYPTHRITVTTDDGSEEVTFTADSSPPELSSASPATGEDRITRTISTVTADVTDPAGIDAGASHLVFNGQRYTTADPELQFSDGRFSLKADDLVQEGQNAVLLHLVDGFGHRTNRSYRFTIAESPVIFEDTASPTGLVSGDRPTLSIEAADSAGITADSTIEIDGETIGLADSDIEEIDAAQNRYRISYEAGPLDDGEYTPSFTISDGNGNTASYDTRFTVDTAGPEFTDGPDINDGDRFTTEIGIDIDVEDMSDIEDVTATIGDIEEDVSQTDSTGYSTTLETGGLDDEYTLEITAEDAAGNTNTVSRQVVVDNQAPRVLEDGTRLFPDPTNRPPALTVQSHDDTTEPVEAEYAIGTDPGVGEGTAIERQSSEVGYATFNGTVATEGLDNGRHNLTIRVQDAVGHWSDPYRMPFLLNRSYSTNLSITGLTVSPVRQGQTTTVTVGVRNTGQVPGTVTATIQDINFSAGEQQRSVGVGLGRSLELGLAPTHDTPIGSYSARIVLTTGSETIERPITITVQPDDQRRDEIAGRIQQLRTEYQQLQNRTTGWSSSLEQDQLTTIQSQLDQAQVALRTTSQQLDEGDYLAAYRTAPRISASIDQAEGNLSAAIEDHRSMQDRIWTLLGLLIAAGLGGLAGLAIYRSQTGGTILPDRLPTVAQLRRRLRQIAGRSEHVLDQDLAALGRYFEQDIEEENEAWSGYDDS